MLFVGFSLTDDNFHRIADEVRRAVRRKRFGTSLSVAGNRHLRRVWEENLDWVELGGLPATGRLLEVMLDRLAARTVATAGHLFDRKYEATLTQADRGLRDELRRLAALVAGVPAADRTGAAWVEVERLLARVGRPPTSKANPGPQPSRPAADKQSQSRSAANAVGRDRACVGRSGNGRGSHRGSAVKTDGGTGARALQRAGALAAPEAEEPQPAGRAHGASAVRPAPAWLRRRPPPGSAARGRPRVPKGGRRRYPRSHTPTAAGQGRTSLWAGP